MKWKRTKAREKKISNQQKYKTKQSKFVNMQKKSVIRGLLNSGPASRNAETIGLKMGHSSKKESNCPKEPEMLQSKDLTNKKSSKISCTEKHQTAKKSEIVVKRRRRTKLEMALSYEARSPHQLDHILDEVGYDCSVKLERRVRGKSDDASGYMKGRGSFWILDDNLIRSVQEKMAKPEEQNFQSPQQTNKPVPLVDLKCLSVKRARVCQNKESDLASIGKSIIQVSRVPPAKTKLTMNKELGDLSVQFENCTETSGFGQTGNVSALNSLHLGLERLVHNKDTGLSGAVVEEICRNLRLANELIAERAHREKQLITEEFATDTGDALEDVALAGTSSSSIQLETQSDEMCSDGLIATSHNEVRDAEDEIMLDYSGDVDISDSEIQSHENDQSSDHSQSLNRCNAEGLTRLEERNKELITWPNITQEHSQLGNDDHFDAIQMTSTSDAQADICFLNSVSLGRCQNVDTEFTNDKEKGAKTPSAQLEMDGRRTHRRKRKQLFTRRKKCKNATKMKFPLADSCNSWSFQSSITDQILSVCRFAESGRVGKMEISPEVESAASVLAMMSAGGRLFSGFQHGERRWDSGQPWQTHPPTANTSWADIQQAGTYMCEVCGNVFLDLTMLRQHMSEHERAIQKPTHRKQLRHKQTAAKIKVARTSDAPATVKSCTSITGGTDVQLQMVQTVECKGKKSDNQPVTDVAELAIFRDVELGRDDGISQMVEEVDSGGRIASADEGSVTNNEVVVKLNEGLCDKKDIELKDVCLNQDDDSLQTVEDDHVELCKTAPPANTRSVMNKDAALVDVSFDQRLSNKTGIDSILQTDVACSQAVVGAQGVVRMSKSEKECIPVGNAKDVLMDVNGAVSNSKMVGQDMCEPHKSGITDARLGTTLTPSQRSALVGSTSDMLIAEPKSSRLTASDVRLLELVEHVVGAMKRSGSVFASEFSTKANSGAVWSANVRCSSGAPWSATVCCICNRTFSSAANTRKHIRMQHDSYRPHKCKICGKAFPYPSSLVEHMTSHATNPRKLVCELCGKVFVRQSGLRKHVKEQHESTRPHACNVCDKRFIYRCLLKEHQRCHSEERTFKCTKCDRVFKQMSNLLMHVKKYHQNVCECPAGNCACPPKAPRPPPSYSCVICSKMFHLQRQLENHMDTHIGRKPLACKVCEEEFPNKFALSKHRLKHQETKTYSCDACNRNFLSMPALKSHRLTHAGIKPYQCENCGKQYTTKNSLKIHSIRHLEVLPHACNKCNKTFALQTNLTKHMAVHTKEHVFVCCHCDLTFHCNTDLKKHILQHEEQKTYVCSYCSKKFLHQSNLKMHVVKHTGERPHSCGVCGRCFSLKANLRRHMQTHMKKNGHIIAESSIPIPGAYVVLGSE